MATASLFPQITQAENWLRNLHLCLQGKPILPQEESLDAILRDEQGHAVQAAAGTLRCSLSAGASKYENYNCMERKIDVRVSPRDYNREVDAALLPRMRECMDKTFADMCRHVEATLANPEDEHIVNLLESKDFAKTQKKIYMRLVMFRTHFALVMVGTMDEDDSHLAASIHVLRFKYTKDALDGLASFGSKDYSAYKIVKMSQHEMNRMHDRRMALAMSRHRRLGNLSHLGKLDDHLLMYMRDQADRVDRAYVERMIMESAAPFLEKRGSLMQPPEYRIRAAFNGCTSKCKQNIAEYVHASAHLDQHAHYALLDDYSFTAKHKWVITVDSPLQVNVSIYLNSMQLNFRITELTCEYMVPFGVDDAQVNVVNRVLEADFEMQHEFVLSTVLNRNDPRILKMFSLKNASGARYIALFDGYGAHVAVSRAGEYGWNSLCNEAYRHCTGMTVTTFPYNERNLKLLKNQYIRQTGEGWQAVDIGYREGAAQVPDIMPEAWHAAQREAAMAATAAHRPQQGSAARNGCTVSSSFCLRCRKIVPFGRDASSSWLQSSL